MRLRLSILFATLAALAACGERDTVSSIGTASAAAACRPIETRPPNAPEQRPAFPGQTRTCGVRSQVAFDVVVVTSRLEEPWSVEPLPGGDLLVTEKAGRLHIVSAKGEIGPPISGVPKVDDRVQGGLLDAALSPHFESDRTIFFSFSEPREGGNGTSVARAVLSTDRRSLSDVRVIFRVTPTYPGVGHYGSRLAFGPDGMLYVTTGERSDSQTRKFAQDLGSTLGKTVRIAPDGSAPKDNPFVGKGGARPEVWSYGHRNIQAAAFDPQGRFWIVEHGTQGGDELNLIRKGRNYGWPVQAYGEEYSGSPIQGAATVREGMEQPVYYWDPVIAPSGAQFYTGDAFPAWRGSLFVGALKEQRLVRLVIEGDRVVGEEHLLTDRRQRIRDVRQGPDGLLYIATTGGQIWKIVPRR